MISAKFENDAYAIETESFTASSTETSYIHSQSYKVFDKQDHKNQELLIRRTPDTILENGNSHPNVKVMLVELQPGDDETPQIHNIAKAEFSMPKNFEKTFGTIDGLMSVYQKLASSPEDTNTSEIKTFCDKYIFNTEESREVLHEFLNKNSSMNSINPALLKNFGRSNR